MNLWITHMKLKIMKLPSRMAQFIKLGLSDIYKFKENHIRLFNSPNKTITSKENWYSLNSQNHPPNNSISLTLLNCQLERYRQTASKFSLIILTVTLCVLLSWLWLKTILKDLRLCMTNPIRKYSLTDLLIRALLNLIKTL